VSPNNLSGSPYLGPKAFTENQSDRFFGRDRETAELTSLAIARRVVLLYAQSGAGKTSLINAGLVPKLRARGTRVLPITRVSGGKTYVDAAISYLAPQQNLTTLGEALGKLLAEDAEPTPTVLILDQFEEIFSVFAEHTEERVAFFEQLNAALQEFSQLSLLISMREDFLASILDYSGYLPDHLRTRMRLERLKYAPALLAVKLPAAAAGKPFESGVAESLVKNLARVRASGSQTQVQGEYVEPVQLQIVCFRLWERLPQTATSISADDIKQYAEVDAVLRDFYLSTLETARKAARVSVRRQRQWFSKHLITPGRTRGLVYRGPKETAGLPNAAVDSLEASYVIRDARGGREWYELTHDRLIEPILDSNREYSQARMRRWLWLVGAAAFGFGLLFMLEFDSIRLTNRALQQKEWLLKATDRELNGGLSCGGELTGCKMPELATLQGMDNLRQTIERVSAANQAAHLRSGFGLFGGVDREDLRKAWYDSFHALLLAPAMGRLRDGMSQPLADPNLLDAYLKITQPGTPIHHDAKREADVLYRSWARCNPALSHDMAAIAQIQFPFYLSYLRDSYHPHQDSDAVQKAQAADQFAPRFVSRLFGEMENFGRAAALNGSSVPFTFTPAGFAVMPRLFSTILSEFRSPLDQETTQRLQAYVENAYRTAYINHWRDALGRIEFKTIPSATTVNQVICWISQNTTINSPEVNQYFAKVHLLCGAAYQKLAAQPNAQAAIDSLVGPASTWKDPVFRDSVRNLLILPIGAAPRLGRLTALSVGVSNYSHMQAIRGFAADADAAAQLFGSQSLSNATLAQIRQALQKTLSGAGPNDTVFVLLEGWGGGAFYYAADTDPANPSTALSFSDLKSSVEAALSRGARVVLATYIIGVAAGHNPVSPLSQVTWKGDQLLGLESGKTGEGLHLAGNGTVFATDLIRALRGDSVTAGQLTDSVRQQVTADTKGVQHPVRYGNMSPDTRIK